MMRRSNSPSYERVERFRPSPYFQTRQTTSNAGRSSPAVYGTRSRSVRTPERVSKSKTKRLWFAFCLFALLAHAFLTTENYMQYETATETVIQMPKEVRPPATTVCFPLWNLVFADKFHNSSKCQTRLLSSRSRIQDCETELLNKSYIVDLLDELTADPTDLIIAFSIRRPSKNGTNWVNSTVVQKKNSVSYRGDQKYTAGYVTSFYRGPYKCIRFDSVPLDSRTLGIDRMTTGYPRARRFFVGYFQIDSRWTQAMSAVRIYVHETGTFPRGEVTLPVVANLTKALSFVVTYTRIETHYLPAPFDHKCIDYRIDYPLSKYDSRTHCISGCIRDQTIAHYNTIPSDHLLTSRSVVSRHLKQKKSLFVSPNEDYVLDYEYSCSAMCQLGCLTKTFYTTLSETAPNSIESTGGPVFDLSTRFENPETSVKFIPRLDFQSYIIYIAGVFGIWFSASIYHFTIDMVSVLSSVFHFLTHAKHQSLSLQS